MKKESHTKLANVPKDSKGNHPSYGSQLKGFRRPLTAHFLKYLGIPGFGLRKVLKAVADEAEGRTGHRGKYMSPTVCSRETCLELFHHLGLFRDETTEIHVDGS